MEMRFRSCQNNFLLLQARDFTGQLQFDIEVVESQMIVIHNAGGGGQQVGKQNTLCTPVWLVKVEFCQ